MRAILIDPFKHEVSHVDTDAGLDDLYRILQVDLITVFPVGAGHAMILDDEGLLRPKETQEYFALKGAEQPFAGRALILADVMGESRDATLPLRAVQDKVVFLNKEDIDPESWAQWEFKII